MEYDFSKLKYPVHLKGDAFTKSPELKNILKEWIKPLNELDIGASKIAKYIVFCYHQHSPLLEIDDIIRRKREGMRLAEIDIIKNEEIVVEIVYNEEETVNYAILQFLKFEKSRNFMALTLQSEAYFNFNFELTKSTGKSTEVSAIKISQLNDSIEALGNKVFSGDTDLIDFVPTFDILERRAIITPEDYANSQ